jgi:energy-converting hydrogenase Eha subunit H
MAASAPLFGAAGLILWQTHAFGSGDLSDAMLGAFMGVGIGIAFASLIKFRRGCP